MYIVWELTCWEEIIEDIVCAFFTSMNHCDKSYCKIASLVFEDKYQI